MLAGRGGADRFVYSDTRYDSYAPRAPDRILDFNREAGRPDRPCRHRRRRRRCPATRAFQFIGQDAFTAAGQVRFFKAGGDTVVEVNTDGRDAGAEMRIEIDPLVNLQAIDFVL